MTPERKDHLYTQYVLTLVNDGKAYYAANRYVADPDADHFVNALHTFMAKIRRGQGESLSVDDRAYIYLAVWCRWGGDMKPLADECTFHDLKCAMYRHLHPKLASQPEPSQEEPAVNNTNATIAFETKHYVYGMDVANMSAGQLIEAIKKIEAEIADLKLVKSKSEHIKKRIAELEDMLAKVVQVLDSK